MLNVNSRQSGVLCIALITVLTVAQGGPQFSTWDLSKGTKEMSLCLAEYICRYQLSDEFCEQSVVQSEVAVPVLVIPERFHIGHIAYTQYVRKCIGFIAIQTIGDRVLHRRFVAVLHLKPSVNETKTNTTSRGFTVYWDVDSGHVGTRPGNPPLGWYPPPYDLTPSQVKRRESNIVALATNESENEIRVFEDAR